MGAPAPPAKAPAGDVELRSEEAFVEALTVAMVVAPGVYARNRMFQFFVRPGAQRAKRRAALLRGILPQLRRVTTLAVEREASGSFVLRYSIAALRLSRVVELTPAELAALRLLASRTDLRVLPPDDADRSLVDAALAKLVEGPSGALCAIGADEGATTAEEAAWRARQSVVSP